MFRQAEKTTIPTKFYYGSVMCWPHQQNTFARVGHDVLSAIRQVDATWMENSAKPNARHKVLMATFLQVLNTFSYHTKCYKLVILQTIFLYSKV